MDRVVILFLQLVFASPSPKNQYELKRQRQAVSRKSKKCNYINDSRFDSTRNTEVVIHPFDAFCVYHIILFLVLSVVDILSSPSLSLMAESKVAFCISFISSKRPSVIHRAKRYSCLVMLVISIIVLKNKVVKHLS